MVKRKLIFMEKKDKPSFTIKFQCPKCKALNVYNCQYYNLISIPTKKCIKCNKWIRLQKYINSSHKKFFNMKELKKRSSNYPKGYNLLIKNLEGLKS